MISPPIIPFERRSSHRGVREGPRGWRSNCVSAAFVWAFGTKPALSTGRAMAASPTAGFKAQQGHAMRYLHNVGEMQGCRGRAGRQGMATCGEPRQILAARNPVHRFTCGNNTVTPQS